MASARAARDARNTPQARASTPPPRLPPPPPPPPLPLQRSASCVGVRRARATLAPRSLLLRHNRTARTQSQARALGAAARLAPGDPPPARRLPHAPCEAGEMQEACMQQAGAAATTTVRAHVPHELRRSAQRLQEGLRCPHLLLAWHAARSAGEGDFEGRAWRVGRAHAARVAGARRSAPRAPAEGVQCQRCSGVSCMPNRTSARALRCLTPQLSWRHDWVFVDIRCAAPLTRYIVTPLNIFT